MGSKFLAAEQSTFMIDLHQVGMMLRYTKMRVARDILHLS
jgi:DNA mismatch repair protein MSH5